MSCPPHQSCYDLFSRGVPLVPDTLPSVTAFAGLVGSLYDEMTRPDMSTFTYFIPKVRTERLNHPTTDFNVLSVYVYTCDEKQSKCLKQGM